MKSSKCCLIFAIIALTLAPLISAHADGGMTDPIDVDDIIGDPTDDDWEDPSGACPGELFNPVTQANWNNMFPIYFMGMAVVPGKYPNTPLMQTAPVCVCTGAYGIPSPGILVSYWEPKYIAEVTPDPGCLHSLGGVRFLPASYKARQGATAEYDEGTGIHNNPRLQVHWYMYPLFQMLEMMTSIGCSSISGFTLAFPSELDPTHQNEPWSAVAFPEAGLFANMFFSLSCSADAVAASMGRPIDPLFYCLGSRTTYPLAGVANAASSRAGANLQVLGTFMAKQTRLAALLLTVGPTAICQSSWSPNLVKSQFRINPVGPRPINRHVVLGKSTLLWASMPSSHPPNRADSTFLIWQGTQCCVNFY